MQYCVVTQQDLLVCAKAGQEVFAKERVRLLAKRKRLIVAPGTKQTFLIKFENVIASFGSSSVQKKKLIAKIEKQKRIQGVFVISKEDKLEVLVFVSPEKVARANAVCFSRVVYILSSFLVSRQSKKMQKRMIVAVLAKSWVVVEPKNKLRSV